MTLQSNVVRFVKRWQASGASERANYQLFLSELCDVLEVDRPQPKGERERENAYVFERGVSFHHADGHTSAGRIDLYKRGCFVLEAKQGSSPTRETPLFGTAPAPRRGVRRDTQAWDAALMKARAQAERYVRALPQDEGRPPFVLVVDVGYSFELYSEFSRTGGTYVPYPTPARCRISLQDLLDEAPREVLRRVWTDPQSLDPTRHSARVTRALAKDLATLARSLELAGEEPGRVAGFLLRAIFTMFAEDVGLLPGGAFRDLLAGLRGNAAHLPHHLTALWRVMNTGGYSTDLRRMLLEFNGGLFADSYVPPVDEAQLGLLIDAAGANWREVEPAIFGTLLERALDPGERHRLGAHYTPRAYVERLVLPTVIEPLREEWAAANAAAASLLAKGRREAALQELEAFHRRLCAVRVLDPACGTGNFLYVTLEHLKRLEGEVLEAVVALSKDERERLELAGVTVSPEQLLGLEVNPRAAKIAELVLWIGYLQWHFRTKGNVLPQEPVIRDLRNVVCRDALLVYERVEAVVDAEDRPLTRWDGRTTRPHPLTGREVPDEAARVEEVRYLNPRRATWPEADFVVGNPPFLGAGPMRQALGHGYAEAVRKTHDDVPESADFVMYWWNHAAHLVREGKLERFGFVTTNSLKQTFNRRVMERFLGGGLSLAYAVPDHPWVDETDGAAVRIAMTVAEPGKHEGVLTRVTGEKPSGNGEYGIEAVDETGVIHSDLTVGVNVTEAKELKAMGGVSNPGVKLHGSGFIVTREKAAEFGLGRREKLERHIREYRNGKDLTNRPRGVMVIDLFGLSADEVRDRYPEVYQHVLTTVKPERDQNNRAGYRNNWWIFGEPRRAFRPALTGLSRYITTVETSKHRFFEFLDVSILPDNKLIAISHDDAFVLGVLSSHIHLTWALAQGSNLGVGNDPVYVKTRCFETFPFPDATEEQRRRVRALAESLDAHRKDRLAAHPNLTMTGVYNVLRKLGTGEALSGTEHLTHQQGLVSVLWEIHLGLDEVVAEAYGWPAAMEGKEVMSRLLTLNAERMAEEKQGLIRWLRPEYQNPGGVALQGGMGLKYEAAASTSAGKHPWPGELPLQARDVRRVVQTLDRFVTASDVAGCFHRAPRSRVGELLETLAGLGQVYKDEARGLYAARGGDGGSDMSI